jgi:hypothetical protein
MNTDTESQETIATDVEAQYMERQMYHKMKFRKQFIFMKEALELVAPEASLASLYELSVRSLEDPMLHRLNDYLNLIIADRQEIYDHDVVRIGVNGDSDHLVADVLPNFYGTDILNHGDMQNGDFGLENGNDQNPYQDIIDLTGE